MPTIKYRLHSQITFVFENIIPLKSISFETKYSYLNKHFPAVKGGFSLDSLRIPKPLFMRLQFICNLRPRRGQGFGDSLPMVFSLLFKTFSFIPLSSHLICRFIAKNFACLPCLSCLSADRRQAGEDSYLPNLLYAEVLWHLSSLYHYLLV